MAHLQGWLQSFVMFRQGGQLAQCLPTALRAFGPLTQQAMDAILPAAAAQTQQLQHPGTPSNKTNSSLCSSSDTCHKASGTAQQQGHMNSQFTKQALGSRRRAILIATKHSIPQGLQAIPTPHHDQQQQPGHRHFMNLPGSLDEFNRPDRAATNALIAACVALSLAALFNRRLFMAMVQINSLLAKGEWWRILTASFIHGGILHLGCNMLALNFLGPPIEQLVGRTCFTVIYLSGALGGGLAYYQYGSWMGSAMGSSGALAGLFSAYVVYKLHNRSVVAWTQYDTSYVGQMLALNIALAFALSSTLAHSAHLGGLVGGGLAMLLLGPRLKWEGGRVVNQPLLPIFKNMP